MPAESISPPQLRTHVDPAVSAAGPRPHPPRVLIICYDFPGIWAAGVIRTYQLAKHLPCFGWQPVILTAQPCSGSQLDDIEASDGELSCPKITVPPSRWLVPFAVDRQRPHTPLDGAPRNHHNRLQGLVRLATQLALPDGKIGWLQPAVKRALSLAQEYPLRLCLSVSPRPTSHLVAYRVARHLNIPWVADFALPWSDAYWLAGRPRLISWLDHRLEALVVRSAQHVTVAYAGLGRSICARHGHSGRERISVVATGFAEDLFQQRSPFSASKFTVVYPGNHFCESGRYGEHFLRAIDEWIDLEPHLEEKVAFMFIGKRDDDLLRQRTTMRHPQVVHLEPLTSHRTCIQRIMSAHMCVVNTVGNRIPAKVYECMRSGTWILALTAPNSDLAALLRHYPRGMSIPPRDTSAIRHALHQIWQCSHLQSPKAIEPGPSLTEYSATYSAEMMAHIFDALTVTRAAELSCYPS